MDNNLFTLGIKEACRRAERLASLLSSDASAARDLSMQAIEELETALEELRVADEEMGIQNDRLTQTHHELISAQMDYELLIDAAFDGYFVTDSFGVIDRVNARAAQLLEIEDRFLVGKPLILFVAEKDRSAFRTELNRPEADRAQRQFDLSLAPRQGGPIPVTLTVVPGRSPEGTPKNRWLLKKRSTETVSEGSPEFPEAQKSLVSDSTRRSQNKNRPEAVPADFLGFLSHALRTPLNAILGWSGILGAGLGDKALIERAIATITRNANAQARIINDLLDLSQMDSDELRLQLVSMELHRLVNASVELGETLAAERQITIETEISKDMPLFKVDPARFNQIMWHLLTNAIKFSPAGSHVQVKLGMAGHNAQISVKDSGIGITPEEMPHLFDRFRPRRITTARAPAGLGLSLPLVKGLVSLHGGTIHVESSGRGLGSTFTVILPAVTTWSTNPCLLTGTYRASINNPAHLDGLNVLIVDDDRDAIEMVSFVLGCSGALVRSATSAVEALNLLATGEVELLLADIAMPGQDGYDLIRQVRLNQKLRLPAIAVTAYVGTEARQRILAAGYDRHLRSPSILKHCCRASRNSAELESQLSSVARAPPHHKSFLLLYPALCIPESHDAGFSAEIILAGSSIVSISSSERIPEPASTSFKETSRLTASLAISAALAYPIRGARAVTSETVRSAYHLHRSASATIPSIHLRVNT